ncbi:hypothetical protein B0O99DRAFT_144069 [Bisporella sp. PMI_857]|nr:hypothetical protein B0O99DRAFT_144069 [Bisporella sp. PMI_857]
MRGICSKNRAIDERRLLILSRFLPVSTKPSILRTLSFQSHHSGVGISLLYMVLLFHGCTLASFSAPIISHDVFFRHHLATYTQHSSSVSVGVAGWHPEARSGKRKDFRPIYPIRKIYLPLTRTSPYSTFCLSFFIIFFYILLRLLFGVTSTLSLQMPSSFLHKREHLLAVGWGWYYPSSQGKG